MPKSDDNPLGRRLKDRRARLDPAAFGLPPTRRRTPGSRREKLAQRANVSATWYTWLEQGRDGTPSADVFDRIAGGFALTTVEREYLFLLAQRRRPQVRYQAPEPVTPHLQRALDSLELSAAVMKTAAWDVVAWSRAAAAVLSHYGSLAPERRNILWIFFSDPRVRTGMADWESEARFVVAAFRSDAARAGASERAGALAEVLSRSNPEFDAIWRDHDVRRYDEGAKHLRRPTVGPVTLEYSSFAVDGHPDLGLVIYTRATPVDGDRIRSLLGART